MTNRFTYLVEREFVIDAARFDDEAYIEARVQQVPAPVHGPMRTTMLYLYRTDGPTNLRPERFKAAEPYLQPAERIVARWLRTRTNGKLRKDYGTRSLRCARVARYRCSACGYPDVRALNLDHVEGRRSEHSTFTCLCANCHSIKSRGVDWLGRAREPV